MAAATSRGHAAGAAMTWGSQSLARTATVVILVACCAAATPQRPLKGTSDHVTTFDKRQRDSDSMSEIVIEHIDGDGQAAAFFIGLLVLGVILIGALLLLGCLLLLRMSESRSAEYHRVSTEDPEIHHERDARPGQSQQFTYVDLGSPIRAGRECSGQGLHAPRFSVQLVTTTETDASEAGLRREQRESPTPAPRSSRPGRAAGEVNSSSPVRRAHSAVSYADPSEAAMATSDGHEAGPQRKRIRVERVSTVSGFRGGSLEDGDGPTTCQECCEQLRSVPGLQDNIKDRFINSGQHDVLLQRPPVSRDVMAETESAGPALKAEINESLTDKNTSTLCEAPLEGYNIYEMSPGGVSSSAYSPSESISSASFSPTEPQFTAPGDQEDVAVYGHGRYYTDPTGGKENCEVYNGMLYSSPGFQSTWQDGLTVGESMTAQTVPVNAVMEGRDNRVEARDGGSVSASSSRDINKQIEEEAAKARRTAVSPRKPAGSARSSVTPTRNDANVEVQESRSTRDPIDAVGTLTHSGELSVQVPEMIAYFDRMHKGLESKAGSECSSRSRVTLASKTARLELPLPPFERTKKEILRKVSGEESALTSGVTSPRSRQDIRSPRKSSSVQEIRQQPTSLTGHPSEARESSNRIEERTVASPSPSVPPFEPTVLLADGEHPRASTSALVKRRSQFPSSDRPQAAFSPATSLESRQLVKIPSDNAGIISPEVDKPIQLSDMHDEVSVDVAASEIAPRGADDENSDGESTTVSMMPDQQISTEATVEERAITDAIGERKTEAYQNQKTIAEVAETPVFNTFERPQHVEASLLPREIAEEQIFRSPARSIAVSGPTVFEKTATSDALTEGSEAAGVLAAKYEHPVPGEPDAGPGKRVEDSSVFPKQLKPNFYHRRNVEDSSVAEQQETNLKPIVSPDFQAESTESQLRPPTETGSSHSVEESAQPGNKTVAATSSATTFLSETLDTDDSDKSSRRLSAREQFKVEAVGEAGVAIHDVVDADKNLPPLQVHVQTSVVPGLTSSASSNITEGEQMFTKEAQLHGQTNLEAMTSENVSVVPTLDKRVSFNDRLQLLSSENRTPENEGATAFPTLPGAKVTVPYGQPKGPLSETTIQDLTPGESLIKRRISSFEALARPVSKTPGSLNFYQRELSTLPADHRALVLPPTNLFQSGIGSHLPDQIKPSAVQTTADFSLPVTKGRDTSHVVLLNDSASASGPLVTLPSSGRRAVAPRTHHKLPIEVSANKKRLEPAGHTNGKLIVTRLAAQHQHVDVAEDNKPLEAAVSPKITAVSSRLQPKWLLADRKNQEVPSDAKSEGNVTSLSDHMTAPLVSQPVGALGQNLPAPPTNPSTPALVPQHPNYVERSSVARSSVQSAADLTESAMKERGSFGVTAESDSVTDEGALVSLGSPSEKMAVPRTAHEPPSEVTGSNNYVEAAAPAKGTKLGLGWQPKLPLGKGANEEMLIAARFGGQVTSPYGHSVAPSVSQTPVDVIAGQQGLAVSTPCSATLASRQPNYLRTQGSTGNVYELKPSAVYAVADSALPEAKSRDSSGVTPTNDTATTIGTLLPLGSPNGQIAPRSPHKLPVEDKRDKRSMQPAESPRQRLIDLATPYGPPDEVIDSKSVEPAGFPEPASHGVLVLRTEHERPVEIVEGNKSILPADSPSRTIVVPRIEPKHPIEVTDDKSIQPAASPIRSAMAPRTEPLHPTEAMKDGKLIEPAASPSLSAVALRTEHTHPTELLEDSKRVEPAARAFSMTPRPLEEHPIEAMENNKSLEPTASAVMPSSFDSSQNNGPSDGTDTLKTPPAEIPSTALVLPLMGGQLVPVGATSDSLKVGGMFAPGETSEEQRPSAPSHEMAPPLAQPQANLGDNRRDLTPSASRKESSIPLLLDSSHKEAGLNNIGRLTQPTFGAADISDMTDAEFEFVGAAGFAESSTITPSGISEEPLSRSSNYDRSPSVPEQSVKLAFGQPKSAPSQAHTEALMISDLDPYQDEGAIGNVGKPNAHTVQTTGASPTPLLSHSPNYDRSPLVPEPPVKRATGKRVPAARRRAQMGALMLSDVDPYQDEGVIIGSVGKANTPTVRATGASPTPSDMSEKHVPSPADYVAAASVSEPPVKLYSGRKESSPTSASIATAALSALDSSRDEGTAESLPRVDTNDKEVDRVNDHSTVAPGGVPEEWAEYSAHATAPTPAGQPPANLGSGQQEAAPPSVRKVTLSSLDYSPNVSVLDPTGRFTTVQATQAVQPANNLPTFATSSREIAALGTNTDSSEVGGMFTHHEKHSLLGTPPNEPTAEENPSGSSSEARQTAVSPDVFFGKNSPVFARGSKDLIVFNQTNNEPMDNPEENQDGPDSPSTRTPVPLKDEAKKPTE